MSILCLVIYVLCVYALKELSGGESCACFRNDYLVFRPSSFILLSNGFGTQ